MILGIDTSCDETSIAVLEPPQKILSNIVSSQVKLHQSYGGIVPELASRAHLENLNVVLDEALTQANISLHDLTGIAVTTAPGLIGCLLTGLSFAKALGFSLKIPLTTVHHLKAHLFSPFLEKKGTMGPVLVSPSGSATHCSSELEKDDFFPFLGLVVSGGHTALYYVKNFDEVECLGETVDDAAGEAFDKVAKLLGLGFPGGPVIDRLSRDGNRDAFSFTRARVKKGLFYFSFSGLKTAVSFLVKEKKAQNFLSDQLVRDISASFQNEVVETLIEKIRLAIKSYPVKGILVSGGVAANSRLRERLEELSQEVQLPCLIPSLLLCTDNGGMVAYVGARQLEQGKVAPLDCNAYASAPMW